MNTNAIRSSPPLGYVKTMRARKSINPCLGHALHLWSSQGKKNHQEARRRRNSKVKYGPSYNPIVREMSIREFPTDRNFCSEKKNRVECWMRIRNPF